MWKVCGLFLLRICQAASRRLIPTASNQDAQQIITITDQDKVNGWVLLGSVIVGRTTGYIRQCPSKTIFIVSDELAVRIQVLKFDIVVIGYETGNLNEK